MFETFNFWKFPVNIKNRDLNAHDLNNMRNNFH